MKLFRIDIFHVAAVVILVLTTVVSCNNIEDDLLPDNKIRLNASVASNVIATKGAGVVSSATTDPLYLGLVRIDETASGFPADFKGLSALTATMQGNGNVKEINFNESYQTFVNESYGVKYASWYPWYEKAAEEEDGEYKYDTENATVTFPIDGSTDVLYGSVATGSKAKGFNTIEYNHALVKYRVLAYAMVPYDETGKPIESYMPDALWGKVKTVTIEDMPPTCVLALPASGGSEYGLTWPNSNLKDYTHGSGVEGEEILNSIPITMDEAAVLTEFIAAPPVDGILKIGVTTSKAQTTQEITIARDFKPGRHYDVRLRFSNHGLINAEVEVSEWAPGEDIDFETGGDVFFDLSTDATANSYMVAPSSYNYCFDVTVKGNGSRGVLDGTDPSLNPGWVDVVWMDAGLADNFRLTSHYPSQGRALFELNKNTSDDSTSEVTYDDIIEGNVLVGAYSEEGGDLLWTWHIWVCDRPQIQSYKNGFTVQDRDLGAVDYEPSADVTKVDGLYYQWGRPTPFPVDRMLNNSFTISSDATVPDVVTAITNPSVFYKDAVVAVAGSNTAKLWGWRSDAEEYVKTIYDPCPPGYRVPSKRLWAELKANNYEIEGHNVKFSVIDGYDIYYPISGYYNGLEATEGLKYYWNGTDSRSDKVGAFMWSATYDAATKDNPYLMTYEYHTDGTYGMTIRPANDDGPALPIRCVAERSTPHVENLSAFQTANSYIVDEEGYYKFDVTVRGNGVGYLVSPGSAETIDVTEGLSMKIDVDHVDYLWWQGDMETGNAISEPPVELDFDGKPVDGYVTFHVDSFRKGNLILAGYDAKGAIIWTWHLWLTDMPKLKQSRDYVVMDRFLGATYAPVATSISDLNMTDDQWKASFGFYYQWGRKDPFPAVTTIPAATSNAETKWWKYDGTEWDELTALESESASGRSVLHSVAEPMVFHKSTKEYGQLPVDGTIGNEFTGDNNKNNRCYGSFFRPENTQSFWGYSSAEGLGKTTSKTIYDPCPPGYSVAYYLGWAGVYAGQDDCSLKSFDDGYAEYDASEKYGILLNPARKSNLYDATLYPLSGYIDPDTATYIGVGTQGHFYTSTPGNYGARSFYYSSSGTGQLMAGNYTGIATSFALPVRCQKD